MCANVECKTYSLARLPKHEECSPAIQVFEFFHCQIYSGYHSLVQCQYLKQFLFFVFAESADEGFETRPYFMTDNCLVKSSYSLENTTGTSSSLSFLMSCPFADWVGLCQRTRAAFALSVGDSLSKRVSWGSFPCQSENYTRSEMIPLSTQFWGAFAQKISTNSKCRIIVPKCEMLSFDFVWYFTLYTLLFHEFHDFSVFWLEDRKHRSWLRPSYH